MYRAYVKCLDPLQQIIVYHFFDPLMDDKSLIIEAQVVKALFVLQILKHCFINIVDVCPCLIFFTYSFVDKIKPFHSILIPFTLVLCSLSFAFFFTMIREPTEEKKVEPPKANAFAMAPLIVNNNDAIYFQPKNDKQSTHSPQSCLCCSQKFCCCILSPFPCLCLNCLEACIYACAH